MRGAQGEVSASERHSGLGGHARRLSKTLPQSIRGRISSPMPIPSGRSDDEFPLEHPGTNVTSTPGPEAQLSATTQPTVLEEDKTAEQGPGPQSVSEPFDDVVRSVGTGSARAPQTSVSSIAQNSPRRRRTTNPSGSSNIRYSVVSSETSRRRNSRERPLRKKSTLRGAIGRLFGRRKKTMSQAISEDTASPEPHQYHGETANLASSGTIPDSKRSVSVPVTEYDRALRSHSIGPEDVLAVESVRNSLNARASLLKGGIGSSQGSGRRPSTRGFEGLAPRPSSTHGKSSRPADVDEDPVIDSEDIPLDGLGLKRRSRSLPALVDFPNKTSDERRRSDEIRFWRESHLPPVMSVESSIAAEEDEYAGLEGRPVTAGQSEKYERSPPQPFVFEEFTSMNDTAGMKITHAANMDTRIGSLEARMRRIERVVTQLCNAVPDYRPRTEGADRAYPCTTIGGSSTDYATSFAPVNLSAYPGSTRPSTQQSRISNISFGDTPAYGEPIQRPVTQPFQPASNRLSSATIRGVTSLPSLQKDPTPPFTIDHYTTLMAWIETERSARLALEAQVRRMGHQINIMSKSPALRRSTQSGGGGQGGQDTSMTSAWDDDDDDEEEEGENEEKHTIGKKRESLRAAPDLNSAEWTPGDNNDDDDDDDGSSEPFSRVSDGSLPTEGLTASSKAKKRTLSLSRLTIGKAKSSKAKGEREGV